jgi:dienelactone hydrolase
MLPPGGAPGLITVNLAAFPGADHDGLMSEIAIPVAGRSLPALLNRSESAVGVVVFVHGTGVDRRDPRDAAVAEALGGARLATLQPELLDARQALDQANALDPGLHLARLRAVLDWLEAQPWAAGLPLGLFGSGIGSGVALLAAAERPRLGAVVCRDGRPDIALFRAASVQAATLLLVEADDWPYRQVLEALPGAKELVVVAADAGFREAPSVSQVAEQACRWFARHLAR